MARPFFILAFSLVFTLMATAAYAVADVSSVTARGGGAGYAIEANISGASAAYAEVVPYTCFDDTSCVTETEEVCDEAGCANVTSTVCSELPLCGSTCESRAYYPGPWPTAELALGEDGIWRGSFDGTGLVAGRRYEVRVHAFDAEGVENPVEDMMGAVGELVDNADYGVTLSIAGGVASGTVVSSDNRTPSGFVYLSPTGVEAPLSAGSYSVAHSLAPGQTLTATFVPDVGCTSLAFSASATVPRIVASSSSGSSGSSSSGSSGSSGSSSSSSSSGGSASDWITCDEGYTLEGAKCVRETSRDEVEAEDTETLSSQSLEGPIAEAIEGDGGAGASELAAAGSAERPAGNAITGAATGARDIGPWGWVSIALGVIVLGLAGYALFRKK